MFYVLLNFLPAFASWLNLDVLFLISFLLAQSLENGLFCELHDFIPKSHMLFVLCCYLCQIHDYFPCLCQLLIDKLFSCADMVKNKGFLPSGPSEIPIQRNQMKEIIYSLLPACKEPDLDSGISFKADAIIANPPAYGKITPFFMAPLALFILFTIIITVRL